MQGLRLVNHKPQLLLLLPLLCRAAFYCCIIAHLHLSCSRNIKVVYEWSLPSLIKNTVPFVINLTSNFIILAILPYYSNSRTFFLRIHSHFYVGSMFRMRRLHLTRSCTSSLDNSLSDKSFLMLSNHHLLFPGPFTTITLFPTQPYYYSLLNTCSCHFNLLSCTFLDISLTFVVALILSFLILSSLVTALIHLLKHPHFRHIKLLLLCFRHCPCLTRLTTVMYSCPFTFKLILRSHRTPETLFHFSPSWLYSMRHLCIQVSILCQCRSYSNSRIRSGIFFGKSYSRPLQNKHSRPSFSCADLP